MSVPPGSSEAALIAAIAAAAGRLPEWVRLGIGDDAAVVAVPQPAGRQLLLSVDCALDGVHVELERQGAERVAAKAVKAALSDIAAMGGGAQGFVLASLTFDARRPASERVALATAVAATSAAFGFTLIGGNLSVAPMGPTALHITVGAWSDRPLARAGARAGDSLWTSGALGGSRAGHHLDFEPRLALVARLRALVEPRAMVDISDGLAHEAGLLASASGLGLVLDAARVPLAQASGGELERALYDGEDYELLFALDPTDAARVPAQLDGVALTRIGVFEPGEGVWLEASDGTRVRLSTTGYDHLARHEERP